MSRRDGPDADGPARVEVTVPDEIYPEERWGGPPPTLYVLVAIVLATLGPLVAALLLAL